MELHYFWRIRLEDRVFKIFVSTGYTLTDIKAMYPGCAVRPISKRDYLGC